MDHNVGEIVEIQGHPHSKHKPVLAQIVRLVWIYIGSWVEYKYRVRVLSQFIPEMPKSVQLDWNGEFEIDLGFINRVIKFDIEWRECEIYPEDLI